MKKILSSILSLGMAFVILSSFVQSKEELFTVDASKSKINWVGGTIAGSSHSGTIPLQKGSLTLAEKQLKGGDFVVDVTGVKVTDLTGDRATRLENHLKNEDFFEVEKFPKASFKITKIAGQGEQVTITGDLTIRDVKKSISFPVVVKRTNNEVSASAKGIKINRTEYGVKYRSGSFFSGLGDRAISDEFTIDIELVATK